MIGEQQFCFPIDAVVDLPEMVAQHAFLKQLFLQPDRDRLAERLKAARRECEIGLEQAFEFEERLFVEHDVVEFAGGDVRRRQAIADRGGRKIRIVLLAREALFLRGGDDLAVHQQGCGAVVVECRNAEDAQRGRSEQRVDERRQR